MAYVDAIHNKEKDEIHIVERINGERVFNVLPAKYVFYYEDPRGRHKTMWGTPCTKFESTSYKQFQKELRNIGANKKIHESDINPVFRCLAENYMNVESPTLNVGFFDIEVDFDPKRGFASPWDTFAPITAISIHLSHLDKMITLVLKPELPKTDKDHLTWEAAEKITQQFDNCFLCNDEEELLKYFLELIQDCDILSGWNSTGFDIPYVVNRIERVLGKDYTKQLCLWGQRPRKRKYIKFKKEHQTYELVGRVHLDYLDLFKKHTPQELHSYRLDFVGETIVGENKTPYEGSLDNLYKRDFHKFIEYNRQDTLLLVKIDAKCRYIELANQLAHGNTVLLQTTMGAVAMIEQAIVNETWLRGMQVPNRRNDAYLHEQNEDDDEDIESGPAVGAYVAVPKSGVHYQIGCTDINSLYPSALRSLNMGPETLVGQIRPERTEELIAQRIRDGWKRADAWHGIFCLVEFDEVQTKSDNQIVVDFEDGNTLQLTGKELHEYLFDKNSTYAISANGTIFRTDVEAVIPGLLSRWYSERKDMQKKAGEFYEKSKTAATPEEKKEALFWNGYWDQRQQARKILLNSLYGALLNEGCRFYDHRIGQSVTLTGRSIAKHMNSKVNECITGLYTHDGEAIVYADTDSSYFSAFSTMQKDPALADMVNDRDQMLALYQGIGDEVNASFPPFMNDTFNTGIERGEIIAAGLELVANRGLFITKKRYAVLKYWDEKSGRLDLGNKPGKIKAMGLDLKRADTPKMMQEFLEHILLEVLQGAERTQIIEEIKEFRQRFRNLKGWMKGTPKKVNGITGYQNAINDHEQRDNFKQLRGMVKDKKMVPGHVQAAINWNKLRRMNNDNYSMEIQDGQKVIVCQLRPNALKMTSVAYPYDEPHLPGWYKDLPFDDEKMESTIIDQKIDNLIGVLEWDLRDAKQDTTFNDLFTF